MNIIFNWRARIWLRCLEKYACLLYSCLRLGTIQDNMRICIFFLLVRQKILSPYQKIIIIILILSLYFQQWHIVISTCSAVLIYIGEQAPKVSFKKPIGSVSVSGHKFVGCPMPCGVQITRLEHINALSRNVEYLASRDATIMGSRNGHAPIFLWYTLNRKGYRGFRKEVQKCLRNAHYLKDQLKDAGIGAMLNELSSTVVFERPQDEEFVRRWQLACQGNIAHVVVMPNVTIEKLDVFLNELVQKRATWFQDGKLQPHCIAADVGKENCLCALHKWQLYQNTSMQFLVCFVVSDICFL